jgi:hypothetical protein
MAEPRTRRPRRLHRRPLRACLVVALALGAAACGDDVTAPVTHDLLDQLNALPGVTAREIAPRYGYPRAFQLDITQPVDHRNPAGATFTQRAYLSHVDETAPMIFGAYGYGATEASGEELAGILQGNGVYVTHRFFPGSRPEPADWRYLDIWQAASDHHRIVTLLREIYPGTWVSAGASKSGMTPLFHRRFFPDDVDATVAYVAPIMFDLADPRFVPHLAATGTAEGRARIHDFQRRLLEHQDSLLWRFEAWFARNGLALSIDPGPTFEDEVDSYEWGFWQRHIFDYDDIPGPAAPYDEWIEHLATVTRMHFASDPWRDYFKAYVYQVHTQLGGPLIDKSHVQDLFRYERLDPQTEYGFPQGLSMAWDASAMEDFAQWIRTQGRGIVLIYGGVDPWTGGAIDVAGNPDVLKVIQPGADHQVRILGLDERGLVLSTLSSWLGLEISAVPERALRVAPPQSDLDLRLPPARLRLR